MTVPRRTGLLRKAVLLSLAWSLGAGPAAAQVEAPDPAVLSAQDQLKRSAEEKIQRDILDPILGKGRATAFVDVEIELQQVKQGRTQLQSGSSEKYLTKEKLQEQQARFQTKYLLPGVPQPKTAAPAPQLAGGRPEEAVGGQTSQGQTIEQTSFAVKKLVRKFSVTVIYDDTIAPEQIRLVRERIDDAFAEYKKAAEASKGKFTYVVSFKPTRFQTLSPLREFTTPSVFVPMTFAFLLALFLLFLFGPLSVLLSRWIRTIQDKGGTEVSVDSRFETAPQQGLGGTGGMGAGAFEGSFEHLSKEMEEEAEKMKPIEPFKYINEENLRRLAYLLRREEPWVIAVVLTYLKPEFARQVLTALPSEVQTRVAIETATIRQVSREQVLAIDAEIKEKVDFVLGGIDHLAKMLEDADEGTRQNILEYLQNEKPGIYEKVRGSIIMFEDIMEFPDRDMQLVVRELKTENMARALQGAMPQVMDKFLANMSTGAASLLKEAMEYEKDLTPVQIEEERKKIMDVIKQMELDGRIHIRDIKRTASLEGLEEEMSSAEGRKSKWGAKPQTVAPGLTGMGYPMAGMGMGYPMMPGLPGMGAYPMGAPMQAFPIGPLPVPGAASAAPAGATQAGREAEAKPEAKAEPKPAEKAETKAAEAPVAPRPAAPAEPPAPAADPQPYMEAGIALYDEGRYEESLTYFEHAARLDPDLWQAQQYLGGALYALGRGEEALRAYERLLELHADPSVREWVDAFKSSVS